MVIDDANGRLWVCVEGANQVKVIACDGDSIVGTFDPGDLPVALAWNPGEKRLYVANFFGNSVTVIRETSGLADAGQDRLSSTARTVFARRGEVLRLDGPAAAKTLHAASGRLAATVRGGQLDTAPLAPGSYFLLGPARAPGRLVVLD